MAAPAVITRENPFGNRAAFKLDDGYRSTIAFASVPGLEIWEKEVQPPGIDNGDDIDTTTMWNENYRTHMPRQLNDLTESTVTGAYDPCIYNNLLVLAGSCENITITFPDLSTLSFWGYIKTVEFSPLVEGEQPEVTLTIQPTNYDCCNCVEAGPVMDCTGTCSC